MKTKPTLQKLLALLCGLFAAATVFAQQATTFTWVGDTNGVNGDTPGNYVTNDFINFQEFNAIFLPNGNGNNGIVPGDRVTWSNRTHTNLFITHTTGAWPNSGFGGQGVSFVMDAAQTNSVQFYNPGGFGTAAQIGVFSVTNNSPNASLTFGSDYNPAAGGNAMRFTGRPAAAYHYYYNNSTAPVTLAGSLDWQAGGGNTYTIEFGGTGDWNLLTVLQNNNAGAGQITVIAHGPGNVSWETNAGTYTGPGGVSGLTGIGQVQIDAGKLILRSAGLLQGFGTNNAANSSITNNATLVYSAPGATWTLPRLIDGTGVLVVSNGTLVLTSPNSVFTGNINLAGGQLTAGSTEVVGVSGPLGVGGTISFGGGALGFSANNTFDYSPRFSALPGQAYRIDTGGQNVTFTNNLGSTGGTLTKLGDGTLTLAGTSSYSGLTSVSGGTLAFQGPKSGSGDITVADGATLGTFEITGSPVTPGTLTLGTSAGASLEFDNVTNTAAAPLAPVAVSSAGTTAVAINSGVFSLGSSYPLLGWSSGAAPAVSLGNVEGAGGNLTTNGGNTIQFNATSVAIIWTGTNSTTWNNSVATTNWTVEGVPTHYTEFDQVVFNDSLASNSDVTLSGALTPTAVTVNNINSNYSITSSGGNKIGGSARFGKRGTGTLTMIGGANDYTGVTTLRGGTLSVGTLTDGGIASDIGAAGSGDTNLVFNGGALRYTGGGAGINRLFTVKSGGGTIDASGTGALILTNTGPIALGGTLTLTGSYESNALAASLIGSGSLTKSGTGRWVLTGTNTYGGGTLINAGILQVGASPSGEIGSGNIVNNAALVFKRTGTLTVPGAISGTGSVTNDGTGTVILVGDNSYTGGTTVNAGTLQVGNGGEGGRLAANGDILNNGALVFNSSGISTFYGAFDGTLVGVISGTGTLRKQGGGRLTLLGANTYTGVTFVDAGGVLQIGSGNQGSTATVGITNNGTLIFIRQDNGVFQLSASIRGSGSVVKDASSGNFGDTTLLVTNDYSGGTFIKGGQIILGDGGTDGWISGNVFFTNSLIQDTLRQLVFNRADDVTFPGNIVGAVVPVFDTNNSGRVVLNGAGQLTLTANGNTWIAGTDINAGTLRIGNGGTGGSMGPGRVINNGQLIFNRNNNLGNVTISGVISGAGTTVAHGNGTVFLTASNTVTGATTVSNGTLVVTRAVGGDMNVYGGVFAPGGYGVVGKMNVWGNLNIGAGTTLMSLNRGLSPSNTLVQVAGTITRGGGSLYLLNVGPALQAGDKFKLFSGAVAGGNLMPIVSPGFTVANNLATDGSVTVTAFTPTTQVITNRIVGTQQIISWPSALLGMHLQAQTNARATGFNNANWVTIPGSEASTSYTNTINKANGTVYYRLAP